MQMLEAGGVEPLMDDHMVADIDNPGGYYEYEKVLDIPQDMSWLGDALGKSMKVLVGGLTALPSNYDYKVIYIHRDPGEVIVSLKRLLVRGGADPSYHDISDVIYREKLYTDRVKRWVLENDNVTLIHINHNQTLREPDNIAKQIANLIPDTDADAMAAAVNRDWYRNRVVDL